MQYQRLLLERTVRFLYPVTLSIVSGLAWWALQPINSARAQIVPDATLPVNSEVDFGCLFSLCEISGGTVRGSNLFHSFSEFSVSTFGFAFFNHAPEIQNILSRVTGNSISNIDGNIRTSGAANLFLINPNGIVFGENASLSVGGSFVASTADSLVFDNGFEYSAANPLPPPLLTVNIPVGLRFRDNPGSIVNQSVAPALFSGSGFGLEVFPGNSIALVGGDVTLSGGGLTAVGGRVELGGLANAGTVGLAVDGNVLSLSFPDDGQLADVTLADDARVSALGFGGGDIFVNANRFTATNGGVLLVGTQGLGKGGNITVDATEFILTGVGPRGFGSGLYNQALPGSSGGLGDITVNAQTVEIIGGGVFAPENVGFETGLQSQIAPGAAGVSGNIFINTESLSISSVAAVRSSVFPGGIGNAGDVVINAKDISSYAKLMTYSFPKPTSTFSTYSTKFIQLS